MKLNSELKSKINKLAHAAGVAHGEQVKLRMIAEAERRLAAGETLAEILRGLDG